MTTVPKRLYAWVCPTPENECPVMKLKAQRGWARQAESPTATLELFGMGTSRSLLPLCHTFMWGKNAFSISDHNSVILHIGELRTQKSQSLREETHASWRESRALLLQSGHQLGLCHLCLSWGGLSSGELINHFSWYYYGLYPERMSCYNESLAFKFAGNGRKISFSISFVPFCCLRIWTDEETDWTEENQSTHVYRRNLRKLSNFTKCLKPSL